MRFLEESQVSSAYGLAVSLVDIIEISSVISLSILAYIWYPYRKTPFYYEWASYVQLQEKVCEPSGIACISA